MSSRARPVPRSTSPDGHRLGVVAYPEGGDVEALLARFADSLRGQGVAVGGLLQRSSREANGRPRMEMIDIESGDTLLISQNLGAKSSACCVDVTGVASASAYLRRAIARRPDLLIINKFSGLEAKGGGLRAEFLEALASGLPVLTGLSMRNREAFEAMAAGAAEFLDASEAALQGWWSGR
jgi:nucleoside-triphosphatase THEP1